MQLLDLCRKLISINSVTVPNGTREIVHFLLPLFRDLGCEVKTQSFPIEGHENLNCLASIGPAQASGALLINTHLDTVSPGPHELWTHCQGNPFQPTIHENHLVGLGAADTKLAMACAMMGLKNILTKRPASTWRAPLHLMGAAGEENGLLGTHYALKHHFVSAQYALDSEPSELNLVWAHKGFAVVRVLFQERKPPAPLQASEQVRAITFSGVAAHSSTPHLGDNALDKVFAAILRGNDNPRWTPFSLNGGIGANVIPPLATLFVRGPAAVETPTGFNEVLAPPPEVLSFDLLRAAATFHNGFQALQRTVSHKREEDFMPPYATTNMTVAKAVKAPHPGLECLIDFRFVHPGEHEAFLRQIQNIITAVSATAPGIELRAELERANHPMLGRKDSFFIKSLIQILRGLNLPGHLKTKSGCTEGALFAAHGMETVVVGPGIADNNIHKPNERVSLEQLEKAALFYEKTIEHFCL